MRPTREFELQVNALECWTIFVEEIGPGEYIASCANHYAEGAGATEEDALEDFNHRAFVAPQLEAKRVHEQRVAAFGRFMGKLRLTPRWIK